MLVSSVLAAATPATAQVAQVNVWMGTLALPTYQEGPPDPNPPFDTYASTEFNYPYTMRTSLTGAKEDHVWRAVFLENEYLKCTVLPDLGGHLYTCLDKINGQSMFYANTAIKKAEIGHRGSWAAFGVEYNFPVSHNWMSLSPVDFAFSKQPDGSASVTVGNIDRPYGMQWTVELILKPGSTALQERVMLHNRSDVRHRFYWWDNAGVRVGDDSRIVYPMKFAASHYFTDIYRWPVLKPGGKDLSFVGNHTDGPVSYFSYGTREGFMGVWNPKTGSGTAQYADFEELPSRKIWSWGSDADGLEWRKALSDDRSSYVEIQAGLFRNQETYAFLEPGETIRFHEYWMPVRGTGGISRANPAGVVSLRSQNGTATVSLNVNQKIQHASLTITQGANTLWSGSTDLEPEGTWTRSVHGSPQGGPFGFELADEQHHSLLKQTEEQYDSDAASTVKLGPQTNYVAPVPEKRSESDWLQIGEDQELNGQLLLALDTYEQARKRYPESFQLQVALGRLATALQHYAAAVPLLEAAQQRDTPNSVVAYYLGLAQAGLGHPREAEMAFDVAFKQATLRAPAGMKLAELHATAGELAPAYVDAAAAAAAEPLNLAAKEQLELLARAEDHTQEADALAQTLLQLEPTSDLLKVETGTPDLAHLAADPYRVLHVATAYMQLGLYKQALAVLETTYPKVPADQSEPGSALPQAHPLVLYYAAYCRQRLGMDPEGALRQAAHLSTALVFPNTEMDRVVLEAALARNNNDVNAKYLLGTLMFSKGQYEEGMALWTETEALAPQMPVVAVDLGKAWLDVRHDPQQALSAFQQGLRSDPTNEAVYTGLDQAMSLTGVPAQARAEALSRYPHADSPAGNMPAGLVYQLALTRAEAGQFPAANALFKSRFLPREEGGISSDEVLLEVLLMQTEAELQEGQCSAAVGLLKERLIPLSANSASAQSSYRMAHIAASCHDDGLATKLLTAAASQNRFADRAWAARAKQELSTPDAQKTVENFRTMVPAAGATPELSEYTAYRWYGVGMMELALQQQDAARRAFENALLLPDEWMAHHLARRALATLSQQQ